VTRGRIAGASVFAVVAGVALSAAIEQGHRRVGSSGQRPYVDGMGWSLAYPRTMHLERSEANMRISVSEVTVASFSMVRAVRTGSTPTSSWLRVDPPRDRHGVFPSDGVAFRMFRREGGPAPNVDSPETRFPLRLSSLRPSRNYPQKSPQPVDHTVTANGGTYIATAWIGPDAPRSLRSTLARVVASLSFPRLRVGETGRRFRVFQPSSRYPIGSFVRVTVQGQPFYLVHAPGGFYAVGWRWQSISGGYKSRCELQLDRRLKQFWCANLGARWDRVGRVITRPSGATLDDPLNMTVAKVAWDGHVLLFPGVARFADERYAHRLWPTWHPGP
jgi:hypothetical protein